MLTKQHILLIACTCFLVGFTSAYSGPFVECQDPQACLVRLGNFAGDLEKVMLELMAIPSNDARRGFTPSMLRTELSSRILNIANYLMARLEIPPETSTDFPKYMVRIKLFHSVIMLASFLQSHIDGEFALTLRAKVLELAQALDHGAALYSAEERVHMAQQQQLNQQMNQMHQFQSQKHFQTRQQHHYQQPPPSRSPSSSARPSSPSSAPKLTKKQNDELEQVIRELVILQKVPVPQNDPIAAAQLQRQVEALNAKILEMWSSGEYGDRIQVANQYTVAEFADNMTFEDELGDAQPTVGHGGLEYRLKDGSIYYAPDSGSYEEDEQVDDDEAEWEERLEEENGNYPDSKNRFDDQYDVVEIDLDAFLKGQKYSSASSLSRGSQKNEEDRTKKRKT